MTKKLDNSLQLYRRLLGYSWPYKGIFLIAVLGMAGYALTQPATAALMKPLLDGGFIEKDADTIRWLPIVVVGLFLARGIASFSAQFALGWIGRKVIFTIRNVVFTHLIDLPTSYYDANASGILISKIIYDIEQIAAAVTKSLFVLIKDGLTVIVLLLYMIYTDWKMTSVFLVIAPVLALVVRIMSRRFRRTSRGIQKSLGDIANVTQESTAGHRIIKAFGAQQVETEAFNTVNEKNRKQATRKVAVSATGVPLMELLASVALALVIYYALGQATVGAMTPGGFAAYMTAMGLMMNPAKRLAKVNEIIQAGLAAAQSVFSLLDEKTEQDTGTVELATVKGRIQYRHVGFRYAGSDRKVLDDVSYTIEPGETLALVGASGSGKSTTANMLPRFYTPMEGEILLDGVNLNELTLSNLRRHMALVSQETVLFNDTLRNNIAYGHTGEVDERRLQDAMRAAHVSEFVETLPEGLDTIIGEKGVRLSGGQRQRLAIARALYKNAPILILDEATSSLDTESERYVQDAMQKLMQHRTTLVIAHRLSTIENADKIVVLSQGRVVETGTHAQLLAKAGAYAALYHSQFDNVIEQRA